MEKNNLYKYLPDIFAIFMMAVIICVYYFSYMHLYLPVQEGWHQIFARNILDGKLPYKDFHFILPPLYAYICATVTHFFGDSFSALRIYGLIERFVMFTCIYFILRKVAPVKYVFFTVISALILYSSVGADFISTFYQTTVVFGIIGLFFCIKYLDCINSNSDNSIKADLYLLLSGFSGALSALTKQSSGVINLFALFIILLFILFINKKNFVKPIISFVLGSALPFVVLMFYLFSNNIFDEFYQMLFSDSLNCKGSSIFALLFGFIGRLFKNGYLIFSIPAFITILFLVGKKASYIPKIQDISIKNIFFNILLFSTVFLIFISIFASTYIVPSGWVTTLTIFKHQLLCPVIFFLTIAGGFYYLYKTVLKKETDTYFQIYFYIFIFSFFSMYAHGMSATIEEHALYLIFPALLCYFLNLNIPLSKVKNLMIYEFTLLLVGICLAYRYNSPCSWWGWYSHPIHFSNVEINSPNAKNYKLSKEEATVYNDVIQLVKTNTTKEDKIYTFPTLMAFYVLTERNSDTFTTFPYFDTYPDKYAIQDAKTLLKSPPKVIIFQEYPEDAWKLHEELFRNGNKSGQREIAKAISSLVNDKSLNYKLFKRYEFEVPIAMFPISVYYRENKGN